MKRIFLTLALIVPMEGPSSAQAPEAGGPSTLTLSAEQRQSVLDHNTENSAQAARAELSGTSLASRQIHGEVGAMIGSNGARGAYGAATIPLGDRAEAAVAFESIRLGRSR